MENGDTSPTGAPHVRDCAIAEEMAELAAVLASKSFSRAFNQAAILNYICQEYAQGRGDAIKEYNVAVQALGRRPDFNPAIDSVVRVEVSRLRRRLEEYYTSEGAGHAIQISLPAVGYLPHFARHTATSRETPEPQSGTVQQPAAAELPLSRSTTRRSTTAWITFAALVLVALAVGAWFYSPESGTSQSLAPVRTSLGTPAAAGETEEIRIAAGSLASKYIDRSGHVWMMDRYFQGGVAISRPERPVGRTLDPVLYQNAREGEFQYDIPLKPGVYELHLHFAEIVHRDTLGSDLEGQRRFDIYVNDQPLLKNFDIVLDAPGSGTADEKVFKDISPARDGHVHLRFVPGMGSAILSGIELLASQAGRALPVRILTASRTMYDRANQFWGADRYFLGGRSLPRLLNVTVQGTADPGLFANVRFGNFWYFIPVPDGGYALTLRFTESNFGVDNIGSPTYASGGVGSRVFDVYCNGVALLKNFDIFKEAGGPNRALAKTFHGLKPNAQGKLVLTFVSVVDYAVVAAIEVQEEIR
jgi:hypothetical protein